MSGDGSRVNAVGPFGPPAIEFRGEFWSADRLRDLAATWLHEVRDAPLSATGFVAMVLGNHPEAVALFFALSGHPYPIITLSTDTRAWRSTPAIPRGTPLLLARPFAGLAGAGEAIGLRPWIMPESERPGRVPAVSADFLRAPGVISFTSGSTSEPRPVYRSMAGVLTEARAIVSVNRLADGASVLGSVPLAFAGFFGFTHVLMVATILRSCIGLLDRVDHRRLLASLRARRFGYWPTTPKMAELLARAPLRDAPPAPAVCLVSGGALPASVAAQFAARFRIPLRPSYGMSEAGVITMDDSPPDRVRPDVVGRPLPGVRVCVGEDPIHPSAPGLLGRVLVRSPWAMLGYGFPPNLDASRLQDGWLTTQDVGVLDAGGFLTLGGRADDAFKTASGHLVAPADIARCLAAFPGVSDVAIVPLNGAVGRLIGALVEAPVGVSSRMLRRHAEGRLPIWAQPRVLAVTRELPRLSGGKLDRRACIDVLEQEAREEEATS